MSDAMAQALRTAAKYTDRHPSEAAKAAGNYAKGKFSWHGETIAIENPKGSIRSGTDKGGKKWQCRLPAVYGYLLGTKAVDGDHVDCYVGDDHASNKVWVIDQIDLKTRAYDEPKCMLDFASKDAAVMAYAKAFSDGKAKERIGSITEMSIPEFKDWANSSAAKKPLGNLNGYAAGGAVMPLTKSGSRAAISSNIRAERDAGKPLRQAVAVALDTARRYAKKASGGAVATRPHHADFASGTTLDRLIEADIANRSGWLPAMPDAGVRGQVIPPEYLENRALTQGRVRDLPLPWRDDFAQGGPVPGYAGGGWLSEMDSPAEVAPLPLPKARAADHPVAPWLREQLDEARNTEGPLHGQEFPEGLFRPLAPLAEMTGVPSIYRGVNTMREEGAGNKIKGAGEVAAGALPAFAMTRTAAPLFSSIPRTLATTAIPQAMQDISSFVPSAHAAESKKEGEAPKTDPVDALRQSLQTLQKQRDTQQKTFDDAKARMDTNRPKNRAPDETRDLKFFDAKREHDKASESLDKLNTRIGETETRVESATKNQQKVEGGERLKQQESDTPWLESALKAAIPYVAPAVGVGLGYAGGKGAGALTRYLDSRATGAADKFLAGNLSKKPWNDRIGNLNRFWSEGSQGSGEFGMPPFSQTNTLPYWKANKKDVAPSHELYPPRSRMGDYVANTGAAGVFAGEGALGLKWGEDAHEEMKGATKAVTDEPSEANIQRYEKAKKDALIADFMLRMGATGALSQGIKGSTAIYSSPATRPNIGRADSERANIIERLAAQKTKAKEAKAKAKESEEKDSSRKQSSSPRSPNGAASLLPLAAPSLLGLAQERALQSLPSIESALPFSSEYEHATGGVVNKPSKHHSHYQPRDKMHRFAGGPVFPKQQGSQVNKPGTAERAMGGSVAAALETARKYAKGGTVHAGLIKGPTGGREDAKPIKVPSGAYILPADIVSAAGGGNTEAGARAFQKMLPPPRKGAYAAGGEVPIAISDGEIVVSPDQVAALGHGDINAGHRALDAMVKRMRADHIRTLESLPGPQR